MQVTAKPVSCYLHDLQSEVDILESKVHALEHDRPDRGDGCVDDAASGQRNRPLALETERPTPSPSTKRADGPEHEELREGWTKWIYREDGHLKRSVIFAICTSIAAFVFGTLVLSLRSATQDKADCIRCHGEGGAGQGAGPGPS